MDVRSTPRWFLGLLVAALAMALALSLVSVHLRLVNAGLGCADWPACYGRIGAVSEAPPSAADGAGSAATTRVATLAHRIIASTLGLAILAIVAVALTRHRHTTGWLVPALLLAVMLTLALLGRWSAGLHRPGIVMANFTGGIALATSLWWLLLRCTRDRHAHASTAAPARGLAGAALIVVTAQIILGGLVSAYFAGLACGPSPTCGGNWVPSLPWQTLTGLFGTLETDAGGRVVIGDTLTGLHMAHRLLGLVAAAIVAALAWRLWRAGRPGAGLALVTLVVAGVVLGLASVRLELERNIVLAHYALAVALLLALMTVAAPVPHRHAVHKT